MGTTTKVLPANLQDNPKKSLLTIAETAEQIGGTISLWRRRIWAREIPVVKIGRKFFLERATVENFYRGRNQLHS
jgi:hypothetical protein